MSTLTLTGGCLCGAVRFEIRGAPVWAGHCHCESCRRFTGAALTSFLGVADHALTLQQGDLTHYATDDGVARGFCADCGASLTYAAEHFPDYIQIHLGALDTPEAVEPIAHVHCSEQLPWLRVHDNLPRYADSAADTDWQAAPD
ncbi:MAG: GFA family protein [Pseudomonadota bacterium]